MSRNSPAILYPFRILGEQTLSLLDSMGAMFIFFLDSLRLVFSSAGQVVKAVRQTYFIGVRSVSVVLLIGIFTGMVIGLQTYYALAKFGSEGFLGAAVSLSLVRELGPVLTALMVTGRAGSSMAAEIGVMRISDQIDALEVMGINPMSYLVSPKLLACIISFPLLTAMFDIIGMFGGYLTGVALLGGNEGIYMYRIESALEPSDIYGGFVKAMVFAVIVCTVCCFQGYFTHLDKDNAGPEGVSNSTTKAVVQSSVLVLAADYILTSILF